MRMYIYIYIYTLDCGHARCVCTHVRVTLDYIFICCCVSNRTNGLALNLKFSDSISNIHRLEAYRKAT